jgi:Trypsin-co-occurring domain 1
MGQKTDPAISVQVVPIAGGRQIGWGTSVVENLGDRISDIKDAIAAGGRAIAESLPDHGLSGWTVKEVTGSFAVTLTAEAGVILSKASAEATVEVSVTFERNAIQETSS